jgi:selenocysteine lyase/cysteine desulfurase
MALTRRDLLVLAAALPGFAGLRRARLPGGPPTLVRHPRGDATDDWEAIARQFVTDGVHLNTGTYGSCPLPVLEATIHHLRAFERMLGQEHPDLDALHQGLASFLGAWPGSVAVVGNTTEAMNIVANGIDLVPGDEILTTTHEHIGGRCCWELQAARRGAVLRTFDPPLDPASDEALVDAWRRELTPRTRVLSISHVLFTTGMIQPVRELVELARSRGIVSVIDGAHPPGMLALDLMAIDADYYASSPHKWLLAPKGTGLLVTRPDRLDATWPLIASGDWQAGDHRRFEHAGTGNESLLAGLAAALEFHRAIGREAIEARVRELATLLFDALDEVPGVRLVSPRGAAHRSAMVSFTKDGTTAEALQRRLGRERIRTRRIAEYGYEYLRLSTHINVLPADLERTVEAIADGRETRDDRRETRDERR